MILCIQDSLKICKTSPFMTASRFQAGTISFYPKPQIGSMRFKFLSITMSTQSTVRRLGDSKIPGIILSQFGHILASLSNFVRRAGFLKIDYLYSHSAGRKLIKEHLDKLNTSDKLYKGVTGPRRHMGSTHFYSMFYSIKALQ